MHIYAAGSCSEHARASYTAELPFCLLGWTGSKQYERFLRQHAADCGMKLNSHRCVPTPFRCREGVSAGWREQCRSPTMKAQRCCALHSHAHWITAAACTQLI